MAQDNPVWYVLWVAVAFFGMLTWYLDKFSKRQELVRISALSGVVSMLSLVIWTWTDF
ncbi:MAG: hypothetical protein ACPH9F_01985 [Candidatus Poseidoniaceae archaeon]